MENIKRPGPIDREMASEEEDPRLQGLQEQIVETKTRVQSLQHEISAVKMSIINTENDVRMAQYKKPITIPERPSTLVGTPQMNEEHEEILRSKRDQIPPLLQELTAVEDQKAQLESELSLLISETDDFESEIVDLTESIRTSSAEGTRLQNEFAYVQRQISERKNEIRLLERLRTEANTAYAQLVDRAENVDGLDGGRLDVENTIEILKVELSSLRTEITQLEEVISGAREENDRDRENNMARQEQFEEAVDWKAEKEDLRAELEALNQQIVVQKTGIVANEKENTAQQNLVAKFGPYVAKWRGKMVENEHADRTIAQLWNDMEEAKRRSEELMKKAEHDMSAILTKNGKLEDEVARRRGTLERTISHFYAEEHQFRKRIEDRRQKAEDEEKKLLAQIQKTKLKLAQKQLRKQSK
jgi:predicted  nucleic acid-binding Zn-ribbon protein